MAYVERQESAVTRLGKSIAILVVVVLAGAIARSLTSAGADAIERQTFTPSKVETAIQKDRDAALLYGEVKARFPDDYEAMLKTVSSAVRSGADETEVARIAFSSMQNFTRGHLREITSAPDATLLEIAESQADIAKSLSVSSPSLCAQFGESGFSAGTQLPQATKPIVAHTARLLIVAADEGSRRPIQRDTREFTTADAEALINGMRSGGLSETQMNFFFSDLAGASVIDKCKITVGLYDTVANMPPAMAARITAIMMMEAGAQ